MANNALSNGRVPQQSEQRFRNDRISDRSKKAPDIPAVENRNWLLHKYYTRHEYRICKTLIEEELVKSNGHNEYANYLKGLILRREGRIQDSLDSFQNSYGVNSTNVNNVRQIAKSLFLLGSHKRAVEAYIEAGKMSDFPDWEIHCNLGECYIKLCESENAERELKKAIELTKNESPYLALARLYVSKDRIDEAIEIYNAALSASGENEEASTELGLLYLKIGDHQRAFQEFGTVLANSPTNTKAILPMAFIMQTHREHDVALSKYKIAAQFMPESPYLWNNIGMCFFGKQKYVAAISCLKRAHYLNPLSLMPACNLGRVLLTTGQPASAAIYLSAAISSEPSNPMPYLLFGLALKRLDDLDGAEKILAKAHSLAPQDPHVLINYAVILEAVGQRIRAAEILVALNDIATVIEVEAQIVQTARDLAAKLGGQRDKTNVELPRTLVEDEV
ncbi:Bardet-Biedl syndrome 4 protein [Venturia canescens]|uniref:Bardet-Biedl syndrome 4 protein n=1 Tax=Venturia canescens TaxID=32260 RepID=UPI001C9C4161|nr:Bardet-Biedl syndrome 4 protein [Venturia canescens]